MCGSAGEKVKKEVEPCKLLPQDPRGGGGSSPSGGTKGGLD